MHNIIKVDDERSGSRTDPWGTPDNTFNVGEDEPSTATYCMSSVSEVVLYPFQNVGVNVDVGQFLKKWNMGYRVKGLLHVKKDHTDFAAVIQGSQPVVDN